MFQGDQTKDHFSPSERPILLWSSFFVSFHFHFNPFFLGFFSIHFSSTFFWGSLFNIFALLLHTHISRKGELNSFWNSIFFQYLPSSIRHLIAYRLREDFSSPLPPNAEGDPWSGYRRKFIRLKRGDYG